MLTNKVCQENFLWNSFHSEATEVPGTKANPLKHSTCMYCSRHNVNSHSFQSFKVCDSLHTTSLLQNNAVSIQELVYKIVYTPKLDSYEVCGLLERLGGNRRPAAYLYVILPLKTATIFYWAFSMLYLIAHHMYFGLPLANLCCNQLLCHPRLCCMKWMHIYSINDLDKVCICKS